jgi:hypothetical protein
MTGWQRLFAEQRVALKTALTPEQCQQRLSDRIAYESIGASEQQWASIGMSDSFSPDALARKPLRGLVTAAGFQVAKGLAWGLPPQLSLARMLFETWARGSFAADQDGTRIFLRLGAPRGLGCLWLGLGTVAFLLALGVVGSAFSSWAVLLIPGAFAGLIVLSRLAAWSDADFLLNVIETTLEASTARAA